MTMDEIEAALEYQQGQIVALNLAVGRLLDVSGKKVASAVCTELLAYVENPGAGAPGAGRSPNPGFPRGLRCRGWRPLLQRSVNAALHGPREWREAVTLIQQTGGTRNEYGEFVPGATTSTPIEVLTAPAGGATSRLTLPEGAALLLFLWARMVFKPLTPPAKWLGKCCSCLCAEL